MPTVVRRFLILCSLIPLCLASAQAADRYLVRLAGTPSASLRAAIVNRIVPTSVLTAKPAERTMSAEQQQALAAAAQWVVVEVTSDQAARLMEDPAVLDVHPNTRLRLHESPLTNDSLAADQFALHRINAKGAWTQATGDGVLVGVVDTGIDWEHPDLVNRLAVRTAEDANGNGRFEPWPSSVVVDGVTGDLNGVDDDGNGYVDDVIGFDFVDQDVRNLGDDRDRDPVPFDEQGHGTSVAGVIAAEANNGIGIAGLAYDARVVTLRAFDATGNAEEDDVAAAIIYGALNGVRVMNLSFGDGVDAPAMHDAIRFAASMGVTLVASAGNSGGVSRQFPAGYDDVITVAATNADDARAPFSSTGSLVDLSAPGQSIVTTAVGGRYRTVSGTSFAAPYVAATAAMLLQQRPQLTPPELRAVLTASSRDLGERGWDGDFGAGRLDADAALRFVGSGNVAITSPINESTVQLFNATDAVPVVGSTTTPLFDRWELLLGRGAEPATWTLLAEGVQAVRDGQLGELTRSRTSDDTYTIRLRIALKDGRSLESRRRVRVVHSDTLRIDSIEVVPAWRDDRRVAVVTVRTSQPSFCRITAENSFTSASFTDQKRRTRLHSLAVDLDPYSTSGTANIEVWAGSDTVQRDVPLAVANEAVPTTGWTDKAGAEFAGYVLNDVRDIYGNGKDMFVMSDLRSGGFGPALTVGRDGIGWGYQDSTTDVWIPRGMGDANGNGRLEVFCHVVGRARLYEAAEVGGNPFATVIFDNNDGRNNAAGMADIDGDGREELLMLSDSGVVVMTWNNGSFVRMGLAANPTPPQPGTIGNRVDEISVGVGDFDGDGRTEIAFGDTDGDLIVSEFTGAGFETDVIVEGEGAGGSGYVAVGDVNGDGLPDIVHGVPDDPYAGRDGEYGRQVWTYRVYTNRNGEYDVLWQDHFYGVRYGIGFRNGVGTGEIDDKPGDDVVICVFPHLYVFGWSQGSMQPLQYRSDVVSPRFLVHDFDGNGRNELGFGVTVPEVGSMTSFDFVEYAADRDRLPTPAGLRGRIEGDTSAVLSWAPAEGAAYYRIFMATSSNGLFREIDTSRLVYKQIDSLKRDLGYRFRVSAIAADGGPDESFRSNIVDLFIDDVRGEIVEHTDTLTLRQLRQGASVVVRYNKPLTESGTPPAAFTLADGNGSVLMAQTVTLAGDSTYVITFGATSSSSGAWTLSASPIPDRNGYPTQAFGNGMVVIDTRPAPMPLYLAQLVVNGTSSITLSYSEPVDGSALVAGNYRLAPLGSVDRVERVDDVRVQVSFGQSPPLAALGSTYSITASNITAASGTPIATDGGNTMSFVLTSPGLDDVYVYPHPVRINTDGAATFANLTQQAEIQILDQRFLQIRVIREVDGNGGASWDLRDASGTPVPPGLYFYKVVGTSTTGQSAESGLKKLMLTR